MPFGLRFQGVRARAQSAKRVSASGRSRDVGLHFDCWVLARASCGVQVGGIGLGVVRGWYIPGTDGKKIKNAIRVRMAGSHEDLDLDFRRDSSSLAVERCHTKMPSGKAREFARPSMPPTAARFRYAENVKMPLIQNGRGERI